MKAIYLPSLLMISISFFGYQGEETFQEFSSTEAEIADVGISLVGEDSGIEFDVASGAGFVGKGVIQSILGKEALASVSFSFMSSAAYDVPCKKTTPTKTEYKFFERSTSISGSISHQVRTSNGKKPQITGYILEGYSESSAQDGASISCPGGWDSDGSPVLISGEIGGLYADGVLIWEVQ